MFYGIFLSKTNELIWAKTRNIFSGTCYFVIFSVKRYRKFPRVIRFHTKKVQKQISYFGEYFSTEKLVSSASQT